MDSIDPISKRISVREYDSREIPEEALKRILEAGRIAPSAMNYQPWKFVVVHDPSRRKALSHGRYAKFLTECPVVIVGCGNKKRSPEWYTVDVTIALQNMVTQATAEGLGSCWIGSFDEDAVKAAIKAPEDHAIVAMLAIGYPKDGKLKIAHKRKSFDEIVSFEDFS
ncbi:MAG: nitroreductase family protein [Candidatus Thermoplasmatota archaeon]|nr:nitroreductase family protein [Candidatus Thermoplasmatota archaeon]